MGSEPYSGNFKLIRSSKGIVGVFCLTRCGNLLIQTDTRDFDQIFAACQVENIPIRGLLGEWGLCSEFWDYLKKKEVIKKEIFASKEILYVVDLRIQRSILPQVSARLLEIKDYDEWNVLSKEYLDEQKIPDSMSEKERQNLFAKLVKERSAWGLFFEDRLAAKAELNAKAFDLAQVGGVFTATGFRQRGLAKNLMLQLLYDVKNNLKLRKLIIFTGEENLPARRLYESLGTHQAGRFSLLFGE
jgi:RimJ/RimL family protein N-acetyltransferase